MTLRRSFISTLAVLSVLASVPHTFAQSPVTIVNISTDTTIDLYKMYNGDGIVDPLQSALFLWDYYNDKGPIARAFFTYNETIEIMNGPAEAASNEVVDIAATNVIYSTANYFYPASLPLGLYHARINGTLNETTSTGGFTIIQATARSPTINVTTSFPIGCGSKIPAPYTPVTSPNSSNFTSLVVDQPSPGYNAVISPNSTSGGTNIMWWYRDARNTEGSGITNVTAQVIDGTTSSPVGPQLSPEAAGDGLITAQFSDVPMQQGGSYKIIMKYHNNVQDGGVSPGNEISFTTEAFNVVSFADYQNDCANVAASNSSSGSSTTGSPGLKPNGGLALFPSTLAWITALFINIL